MVGFGISLSLLAAIVPIAEVSSPLKDPERAATPRILLSAVATPAGSTVEAVLTFDIAEHWHVYFDGENDSGQPPMVSAEGLPTGVTLESLRWATPKRQLLDGGILDSTYEKRVELPFRVVIGKAAAVGEYSGKFDVRWMECASVCRMSDATVGWTIKVLPAGAKAEASADAKAVTAANEALPKVWTPELAKQRKDSLTIETVVTSEGARLRVRAAKARGIEYHARAGSVALADAVNEGATSSGALDAALALGEKERADPKAAVRGVVVVINEQGLREGYELNVSVGVILKTSGVTPKPEDEGKEVPKP